MQFCQEFAGIGRRRPAGRNVGAPSRSPSIHFCRIKDRRMSRGVGSSMGLAIKVAADRGVARLSASWMNLYSFLGYVGKGKIPLDRLFSYASRLGIVLVLSGCSASDAAMMLQSGRVVGLGGLDGRWQGAVQPTKLGCGNETTGLMTIGQGSFGFAPFENTVAIKGEVGSDKVFNGALERLGGDKKSIRIVMQAHQADDSEIVGNLVSGRCEWSFKLTRG